MKKIQLGITLAAFSLAFSAMAGLTPVDLRCDYAVNPLGVDSTSPRLFWELQSDERGQSQSAYQILVASSEKILAKDAGDLWDSGKIISDETIQIDYAGKKLNSFQKVFWKVRAWDVGWKNFRMEPTGDVDDGRAFDK